ncbi:MAG: proton-conducting transporter membrane subunit [Lachnospiraceae bacterium]
MNTNIIMLLVVLIPFIAGAVVRVVPCRNRRYMDIFLESAVIINTLLVYYLLLHRPADSLTVIHFTGNLSVTFRMDGMACIFAGLVATLWPLATLYSFEYMKKEEHEKTFFMFFTMTYGVTLGIAMAGNIITMYFFYELLTLVTVPLVMHTLTREAILASRKYLYYSLGGAAFAFIGVIFVIIYGDTTDFVLGGVLNMAKIGKQVTPLLFVYVMTFLGFGVKAAICPFNSWLPQAGVAPTPVTALLHAVAVVKSGAFAILRITYFSFGTAFLKGTWAQDVVMIIVIITIVYGCSMALKETHLKRRLAFSTISNLSYILFGATLMSPLGLIGALAHLVFHAVMKICSFFCAGAIIYQTDRKYIHQLDGLGRKMPLVFGIFTVSGMALMGVPGLCGFISKWNLASAAVQSGNVIAYVGVAALLISALLTAIYMLTISVRAFFPAQGFDYETIKDVKDPNWLMTVPLLCFVVAIVYFGLHSAPMISFITDVANGIL